MQMIPQGWQPQQFGQENVVPQLGQGHPLPNLGNSNHSVRPGGSNRRNRPYLQSHLGSPNDEVEDMSTYADSMAGDSTQVSEEELEEDNTSKILKKSFADKVSFLHTVSPRLVSTVCKDTDIQTEADKIFDRSSSDEPALVLLESGAVKGELKKAQALAMDTSSTKVQECTLGRREVPDFPRALPCGRFLKIRQPPFPKKSIQLDSIPEASLSVSAEDLLLSKKEKGQRNVVVSDRGMVLWEEAARRGLESVSVIDSFFGGTLNSIFKKGENGVEVRQDLDPKEVQILSDQVSDNIRFIAHTMATLHTNIVMARRDAVLADSSIPTEKRASLRVLPPHKTLFDEHVQPVIKAHADLMRDLSFQPSKQMKRPATKGGHESAHSAPKKKQTFSKPKFQKGARSGGGNSNKNSQPKASTSKAKDF